MTPERGKRSGELFAKAIRSGPTRREPCLRAAHGIDRGVRSEIVRLLDVGVKGAWSQVLPSPAPSSRGPNPTESWPIQGGGWPPIGRQKTIGLAPDDRVVGTHGFSPRAVIAAGPQPYASPAAETSVRARLRELPMNYILFLAMATFWRALILGDHDRLLHYLDVTIIIGLGGVIARLSSRRPIPIAHLRALELGIIGILAGRVALVEYRLVALFSQRNDPVMAFLTVKNIVILTAILILTYGLYVPKTWRRAALVAGPLALLPFVTLSVLLLRQPGAMAWLGRGPKGNEVPRYLLFGFDAMTLPIVAVGSAFGARANARLRRQVAEARQLGQYFLRQGLGAGGMGIVYLAEHQLLKRPCALKLIRPGVDADPKARARFEREVRLTASLSHPNTVEVYDYGRTEDGTYYYVMEYLPGMNLAELVERHGPSPPGRAVYLLRQVCGALREAHAAGLIHRDIKPTNVFVSRRGGVDDVAKLLDFGLVRPVHVPDTLQLSGEGQVLGTPQFMSPEQALGWGELDGRSDIYSLGAVAYFLLTGRPPFDGQDGLQLMAAHARDPVKPLSQFRDNIPEDLERIVLRCLAKNAADRFPDARDLEQALGTCACIKEWDQDLANQWWRIVDQTTHNEQRI